ncbi:MAG: response regulator [Acidobacteriota bacterium]
MKKFEKQIENSSGFSQFHSTPIDLLKRKKYLTLILFISIVSLIIFSLIAFFDRNYILLIIDLSALSLLTLNLLNLRGKSNIEANIFFGISVVAALFIYLFLTQGNYNTGFVWYFTFPMVAFFLMGAVKGILWSSSLLIPVIFTAFFPLPEWGFTRYSGGFLLRFSIAYIIVLIFSYLTERTWENLRDELFNIQNSLEERVTARTTELRSVNKNLKNEVIEKERAREALKLSEKHYRLITEKTSDLISITTFSIRPVYKYVSPSHIQLGYTPEDLIGRSGFEFMHPGDKKKMVSLLKQYLGGKIREVVSRKDAEFRMTLEYRLYDKSGKLQYIESTVNIIGKELLFVSKLITERKKEEKEKKKIREMMLRAEKMETLGQLAGGVAHDLNNVLSGIVGYPDLILRKLPENSDLVKKVNAIKSSGVKAAAMIEDLMVLAQRRLIKKEMVSLNKVIDEYLSSPEFEKLFSLHHGIKVNKNLEIDLPDIEGSLIHLNKMLMNLMANALEAMPDGGKVTISTLSGKVKSAIRGNSKIIEKGNYVILKITDTGVGIGHRSLKKIFEPFYTKKMKKKSGTGLGMLIIHRIVMDHNGEIVIKSVKRKGTTFEIYFPKTRKRKKGDTVIKSAENYLGDGELILIVDDNMDHGLLVENMLTTMGYRAEKVPSGERAIEYVRKKVPDLVILDMIMDPGMNGYETYIKLKEIDPHIKVLLSSGYSEAENIKNAMKNGIDHFLKKPFSIDQLGKSVKDGLEK